jgi:hypothetical protein
MQLAQNDANGGQTHYDISEFGIRVVQAGAQQRRDRTPRAGQLG